MHAHAPERRAHARALHLVQDAHALPRRRRRRPGPLCARVRATLEALAGRAGRLRVPQAAARAGRPLALRGVGPGRCGCRHRGLCMAACVDACRGLRALQVRDCAQEALAVPHGRHAQLRLVARLCVSTRGLVHACGPCRQQAALVSRFTNPVTCCRTSSVQTGVPLSASCLGWHAVAVMPLLSSCAITQRL
jgi:hypothetical protein